MADQLTRDTQILPQDVLAQPPETMLDRAKAILIERLSAYKQQFERRFTKAGHDPVNLQDLALYQLSSWPTFIFGQGNHCPGIFGKQRADKFLGKLRQIDSLIDIFKLIYSYLDSGTRMPMILVNAVHETIAGDGNYARACDVLLEIKKLDRQLDPVSRIGTVYENKFLQNGMLDLLCRLVVACQDEHEVGDLLSSLANTDVTDNDQLKTMMDKIKQLLNRIDEQRDVINFDLATSRPQPC